MEMERIQMYWCGMERVPPLIFKILSHRSQRHLYFAVMSWVFFESIEICTNKWRCSCNIRPFVSFLDPWFLAKLSGFVVQFPSLVCGETVGAVPKKATNQNNLMPNLPKIPKIKIKLCSLTPCTPGFYTRCRPVLFTTTNEGHWIHEMFSRRPSHLRIIPSAPAYERSVRKCP